jgi:hypothetical protein
VPSTVHGTPLLAFPNPGSCLSPIDRLPLQFHPDLESDAQLHESRRPLVTSTALSPTDRFSFNVHGVLYVGDDEHIAPVETEIRDLSSGLQMVKDEQAYLVVRERVHRNSESGEAR